MWSQLPDFDTLKEAAETSPEALENFRQHAIEAAIQNAPQNTRERLRGLQFQIDSQRRLHSTALGSCIKISGMMHDSFFSLREHISQLTNPQAALLITENRPLSSVLKFQPR